MGQLKSSFFLGERGVRRWNRSGPEAQLKGEAFPGDIKKPLSLMVAGQGLDEL